ncbi:tRNA pseudouridine(38-40) synthase TruA [Alteribacillus iranensis]|uniref:tRNA pseudouridine synthase A n=1 Tax=Alteribacillus iranensis TaxID=930128 RepID=A0A1I2F6Y7_9BACI|nr:tRNA pseudouridine(38-40) synthase TruA [Alteribacillus iranensis]SFF00311.1 tRNA pseudouridine38-40 synthase [Alteribacillus iranensis]
MQRIKAVVSYDGTDFSGWQVQPEKRTVQSEIEKALTKIHKGSHVEVTASGRTDASVHALGQVMHFDTPLCIPDEKWPKAINSHLPEDVYVLAAERTTADFHARFDAIEKEYIYRVQTNSQPDIFRRRYTLFYPYPLNIENMKQAAEHLVGTHDFTSFCASGTDVKDMVRTVYKIDILEDRDELQFVLRGNGFLYNMVRIMVGTLLEVGRGKKAPHDISELLAARDRGKAGKTVPGHGLFLAEVKYKNRVSSNYA